MDYSRKRECDVSQGGNEFIYLLPFEVDFRKEGIINGNILTSLTEKTIYGIGADSISFDEDVSDEPDLTYDQNLTFQIHSILPTDNFKELICRDFSFIVKDNNGNLRFLGFNTGMIGKFKKTTGVNRSDFNGYSFTFTTKENRTAPFLTDLSLFKIENHLDDLLQYLI